MSRPAFIESDVGLDFSYKTKLLNLYAEYGVPRPTFLTPCDLAVPTRPVHEFRQYEVLRRRSWTFGSLQIMLCDTEAIRRAKIPGFMRRDNEDPLRTATYAQDEDNIVDTT